MTSWQRTSSLLSCSKYLTCVRHVYMSRKIFCPTVPANEDTSAVNNALHDSNQGVTLTKLTVSEVLTIANVGQRVTIQVECSC